MKLIPAIDIIEGKCVRLTQGDYAQKKIYNEDPLEVARLFQDQGVEYLHLVDLDGAKANKIVNAKTLERIATGTRLKIDFGGGIKTDESIKTAFECGAQQITGGSVAVNNKALFSKWIKEYGTEKIMLGADVRNEKVAVNGWEEDTTINIFDFLDHYIKDGIQYVICTDIHKDGTLQGSAISLYERIRKRFNNIGLIASGGITSMDELKQLSAMGMHGAIIGKALYEGKIKLKELKSFHYAH